MNKIYALVNKIIVVTLYVFMLFQLGIKLHSMSLSKILTTLSIIPILLVPLLIKKLFKYDVSEELKLIYYLFIIVSLVLGSILGLYYKISWFDLLAHFLSGAFVSFASLILIKHKRLLKKENTGFIILFMLSASLMVASCWEFFEFFSDKILGGDVQWVAKTGVDDTMTDMLIAFLGSIIYSIHFLIQVKLNDKKYFKKLDRII